VTGLDRNEEFGMDIMGRYGVRVFSIWRYQLDVVQARFSAFFMFL
jgi:hypothetical protein